MSSNTTSAVQSLEGASLSQFLTTLIVSGIIALIEVTIFLIIRTKFKRIYEPKTYIGDENRRVEPLPKTFIGWLPSLLKMPQEDLIRISGLDAYFFGRYLYIHAFFFISSFIILSIILLPIYIVDGKGESYGKKGLDILTFGNISPSNSSRYAAPLVLAYVFICSFLYILYCEMKNFVVKRQLLLRSSAYESRASATTILVTEIPKRYMSENNLFKIFDKFPGGVKRIWLNRNLEDLPDKVEQRMKLVEKFETVQCKLIKNILKKVNKDIYPVIIGDNIIKNYINEKNRSKMRIGSIPLLSSLCFGKKVDTIKYCKETISKLNNEIERAKLNDENYLVLNSAFIQFNKQIGAHMAIQSVLSSIPLRMTSKYINIKPENIIWSNLKLSYYEKKVRKVLMLSATTILIIFWAIPVSFIGILSNITYLINKLTFLKFICNLPDFLLGLITGLLPSILLSILMSLLPIILKLFAKLSGIPTSDAIDRYVQGSYFVFQVVHVFLFVTISSSVSSVVTGIIQNPSSAAILLASNIPTASNFFFSYLSLQGLSIAAGVLLQIITLILFYLFSKLFDNTPRKKWKRYFTLSSLSWGTIFPLFTNFVVITLVYSIIAPIMLLISGIAFILFYISYIYQMFYVSNFPNDSGGLTFPTAIYQSFTGVYLMEIMLAALFFLAQDETGSQSAIPQGILMCILIIITIIIQYIINSSFNSLTYYLPVDSQEFSKLDKSLSKQYPWTKTQNKILNISQIFDENDNNINNSVNEFYDNSMDNAYMHPAIRDPTPIIWIPKDILGIAEDQVEQVYSSQLNIIISTQGAIFDQNNNIKIHSPPPDYIQNTEQNYIQTRF